MSYEALIALIVVLVGSHYASLIYRLHKAEGDLAEMRRDFTTAAINAANAAVVAAQAVAAAAAAIAAKGKA